jgi:uncharacterized protein
MKGSGSANAERAAAGACRFADGVLTVALHVQPGAARSGWAGSHGAALKLRLAAPASEGRANRACVDFLAAAAGVPRSAVQIVRGERSRDKLVRIAPLSEAQFRELQRQWQA